MTTTNFPNGISDQGTVNAYGTESIAAGAGTITTGLTSVAGFTLQVVAAGTATAEVYAASGTLSGGDIVVETFRASGAAATGTADVNWHAWGA